ncbi:MAG: hypothetical protein M1814_002082 [Vezdaea aestivalis]|nr:MAG: hypothetical protein M1814_002082 [Vezdaea aestivalis]
MPPCSFPSSSIGSYIPTPICRFAAIQARAASSTSKDGARYKTVRRRRFESWINSPLGTKLRYAPPPDWSSYLTSRNRATGRLSKLEMAISARKENSKKKETTDYQDYEPLDPNVAPTATISAMNQRHTPFPQNSAFVSLPILDEEVRENIWLKVYVGGESIESVSRELCVDIRRVAAVTRLMTIQRRWERENKPLANAYSDAIMSMVPTTKPGVPSVEELNASRGDTLEELETVAIYEDGAYNVSIKGPGTAPEENRDPKDPNSPFYRGLHSRPMIPTGSSEPVRHEDIFELPLHAHAGPQIFLPTSESRSFSRADAAAAFSETLRPADDRIPHPSLIGQLQVAQAGFSQKEQDIVHGFEQEKAERQRDKRKYREAVKEAATVVIPQKGGSSRWEWRFKDINIESGGRSGRRGVGWRYGAPLMDRKKGDVKIPTEAAE